MASDVIGILYHFQRILSFIAGNRINWLHDMIWYDWMNEWNGMMINCNNWFDVCSYSRHGRDIAVLPSMVNQFPKMGIDYELWFGRGQFAYSYSLINHSPAIPWDHLRYNNCLLFFFERIIIIIIIYYNDCFRGLAFDVAFYEFHSIPFEGRFTHLLHSIKVDHPFAISYNNADE